MRDKRIDYTEDGLPCRNRKDRGVYLSPYEGEECENCYFYWKIFCKRYPTPIKKAEVDWCGEWAEGDGNSSGRS